jgi:hypothetical protein
MPQLYDPPSGWQFGFPKIFPGTRSTKDQLIADGYPAADAEWAAKHCRFWGTKEQTMTYEEWLRAVDAELDTRFGLCMDLLPDWLSRDAYDGGMTPVQGAAQCVEEIGLDEQLVDEL